MSSSLPEIAALPQPTISTLRSSTIITSLPQALNELVQNALDANARHIAVFLDLDRWGLRVEDDGTGMRKEAVNALGTGERYGQSRELEGRKGGGSWSSTQAHLHSSLSLPFSSFDCNRDLKDDSESFSYSTLDFRLQGRG